MQLELPIEWVLTFVVEAFEGLDRPAAQSCTAAPPQLARAIDSTDREQWLSFQGPPRAVHVLLKAVRELFRGRGDAVDCRVFSEKIAPALTMTWAAEANESLCAQIDVAAVGRISWRLFSAFLAKWTGDGVAEAALEADFIVSESVPEQRHRGDVTVIATAKSATASANGAMDRFCFTGDDRGAVFMWDGIFLKPAGVVAPPVPGRCVVDMTFTVAGRLAVVDAPTRMRTVIVNPQAPAVPYRHYCLRRGTSREGLSFAEVLLSTSRLGSITSVISPPALGSANSECVLLSTSGGLIHLYDLHRTSGYTFDSGRRVVNVPADTILPSWTASLPSRAAVLQLVAGEPRHCFYALQHIDDVSAALHTFDMERMATEISLTLKNDEHPHPITRVACDATASLALASGPVRTASLFSTTFGTCLATLSDHTAPVIGAAMVGGAHQMITATADGLFSIYDTRTYRKAQTFKYDLPPFTTHVAGFGYDYAHGRPLSATASPLALTRSDVPVVGKVNAERRAAANLSPSGSANSLGGTLLLAASQQLVTLEGPNLVVRSVHCPEAVKATLATSAPIQHAAVDEPERRVALSRDQCRIDIVSAVQGSLLTSVHLPSQGRTSSAADSIRSLAFATRSRRRPVLAVGTFRGAVAFYSCHDDDPQLLFEDRLAGSILSMTAAGPNRGRVVVGTSEGCVFLYELEHFRRTLLATFDLVHSAPLSTDEAVATAGRQASVSTLESFCARCYSSLNRGCELVVAIDAQHVVSAHGTGLITLYRIGSLEIMRVFAFPSTIAAASVSAVAYSPQERLLVVGDFAGYVTFFDLSPYFDGTSPLPAVQSTIADKISLIGCTQVLAGALLSDIHLMRRGDGPPSLVVSLSEAMVVVEYSLPDMTPRAIIAHPSRQAVVGPAIGAGVLCWAEAGPPPSAQSALARRMREIATPTQAGHPFLSTQSTAATATGDQQPVAASPEGRSSPVADESGAGAGMEPRPEVASPRYPCRMQARGGSARRPLQHAAPPHPPKTPRRQGYVFLPSHPSDHSIPEHKRALLEVHTPLAQFLIDHSKERVCKVVSDVAAAVLPPPDRCGDEAARRLYPSDHPLPRPPVSPRGGFLLSRPPSQKGGRRPNDTGANAPPSPQRAVQYPQPPAAKTDCSAPQVFNAQPPQYRSPVRRPTTPVFSPRRWSFSVDAASPLAPLAAAHGCVVRPQSNVALSPPPSTRFVRSAQSSVYSRLKAAPINVDSLLQRPSRRKL